jgi:hypothetical protein
MHSLNKICLPSIHPQFFAHVKAATKSYARGYISFLVNKKWLLFKKTTRRFPIPGGIPFSLRWNFF